MKRDPTGFKPPNPALRAARTTRNFCLGLAMVFCLDVWPMLRTFPRKFWILVAFILVWYGADPIIVGDYWRYLTLGLAPALVIAPMWKWDPPPPRTSWKHTIRTYDLPRMLVPLLGYTTLMEFNYNWILRLIGGGIAVAWQAGVLYRAHRKRKMQVIERMLEREHQRFRNIMGLPNTADLATDGQRVLDDYGWWLSNNHEKLRLEWEGTNGRPQD